MKQLILVILGLNVMVMSDMYAAGHETKDLVILTRLFQGEKSNKGGDVLVSGRIIDPYSQSFSEYLDQEKEEAARIKKVYNLAAVHPLIMAKWHWEEKKPGNLANTLLLKQKTLSIKMDQLGGDRFRIAIIDGPKFTPQYKELLSTEFILPAGHTTIFGFKDGGDALYFLSFHHMGTAPAMTGKDFKPTPDKIIAKTMPQYPQSALENKKEGTVIIKGEFDDSGSIVEKSIEIVSGNDEFNESVKKVFSELKYDPEYTPVPLNKSLVVVMFRMEEEDGVDQFAEKEYRRIQDSTLYREQMEMMKEDEKKGRVWLRFGVLVNPKKTN